MTHTDDELKYRLKNLKCKVTVGGEEADITEILADYEVDAIHQIIYQDRNQLLDRVQSAIKTELSGFEEGGEVRAILNTNKQRLITAIEALKNDKELS